MTVITTMHSAVKLRRVQQGNKMLDLQAWREVVWEHSTIEVYAMARKCGHFFWSPPKLLSPCIVPKSVVLQVPWEVGSHCYLVVLFGEAITCIIGILGDSWG